MTAGADELLILRFIENPKWSPYEVVSQFEFRQAELLDYRKGVQ
jgi:hypothetical protein